MKKQRIISLTLLLALGLSSFVWLKPKPIKVYLIGDSTIANKEAVVHPETGWGMPFTDFFDETVEIVNRARNGRSTRTFLSENRWVPIADSLNKGDYVLIQFGHNDEATGEKYKDRYTSPTDYRTNLIRFITETRSKKAIPVLITPVTRRYFSNDGHIKETHIEYSKVVHAVGIQYKVPVIDLDERSRAFFEKYGPEDSKIFFNHLAPGENPHYPNGIKDDTHFNELGARKVAEMVLKSIKDLHLELAERIVKPKVK
jgi:lysophospholipase L1-like esterase